MNPGSVARKFLCTDIGALTPASFSISIIAFTIA